MECPGLLGRGTKGFEKSRIFFALKVDPVDATVTPATLDAGLGVLLLLRMECPGLLGRVFNKRSLSALLGVPGLLRMECPGLLGRGANGFEKFGIFFALKCLPGDPNVSLAALDALLLRMECPGLLGRVFNKRSLLVWLGVPG